MTERLSWDAWLVLLADFIGQRSKDPSTQVGAVITRPDKTIAATGYNGFPRAIEDVPELLNSREEKYPRVIHAEMNAILTAREPLHGYSMHISLHPCDRCAVHVIQAGITKVVWPVVSAAHRERWGSGMVLAEELFREAGVEMFQVGAGMRNVVQL